jgi:hypothetical protein
MARPLDPIGDGTPDASEVGRYLPEDRQRMRAEGESNVDRRSRKRALVDKLAGEDGKVIANQGLGVAVLPHRVPLVSPPGCEEMEDEDGALLRRKSPEAAVQLVTVVDRQELVGVGRCVLRRSRR